ncbi:family 10 glycosylhydrolase [Candidatus Sumerlaeota bacterium]|nr:family 10 glycosylhydrolase [Candidatus Sumerlaeota bacterium]
MMTNQRPAIRLFLAGALLFLGAMAGFAAPPTGGRVEWRSVWVTRFEWTKGNRQEITARLNRIMDDLGAARINAVLFQVRGQGDTLYPSREEPWSPLISRSARDFDPVNVAIAGAHRNGVQFHAWINLSVIWQSSGKNLPDDKRHPLYRFANAGNARARLGLIHDSNGRPRQFGADDYVWLTHGNPQVNAYLRRQVMLFLQDHTVDGIHLDDRTGMPNGASRDPISLERFKGRGNPGRFKDLGEWQRDQLSRFLSDLYVQCKERDPRLLVTISPFGIADRNRIPGYGKFSDAERFGVEPEKWLRMGVVDALIPQIYWDDVDPAPNYSTVLKDWLNNNRSGRPIWPGSALGKYGKAPQPLSPVQMRYVNISRSFNAGGNSFFSYGGATSSQWRGSGLYKDRARVPIPAHMQPGRYGQIAGTIADGARQPVTDAWIQVQGAQMIYLSGADGFFGIPNVKPGSYKLLVTMPNGAKTTRDVSVSADRTTRVNLP